MLYSVTQTDVCLGTDIALAYANWHKRLAGQEESHLRQLRGGFLLLPKEAERDILYSSQTKRDYRVIPLGNPNTYS